MQSVRAGEIDEAEKLFRNVNTIWRECPDTKVVHEAIAEWKKEYERRRKKVGECKANRGFGNTNQECDWQKCVVFDYH